TLLHVVRSGGLEAALVGGGLGGRTTLAVVRPGPTWWPSRTTASADRPSTHRRLRPHLAGAKACLTARSSPSVPRPLRRVARAPLEARVDSARSSSGPYQEETIMTQVTERAVLAGG